MCSLFGFLLGCYRPVNAPRALRENDTLVLVNQSARYICYKHKSYIYNKVYYHYASTVVDSFSFGGFFNVGVFFFTNCKGPLVKFHFVFLDQLQFSKSNLFIKFKPRE